MTRSRIWIRDEGFDVFSLRDLRRRPGGLLAATEQGKPALVTHRGRPAFLAIPFDELLLSHGTHRALAFHLFEAGQVTLAQGARLAELPLEQFAELMGTCPTGSFHINYQHEGHTDHV